jgi:hypothetical protein
MARASPHQENTEVEARAFLDFKEQASPKVQCEGVASQYFGHTLCTMGAGLWRLGASVHKVLKVRVRPPALSLLCYIALECTA